ncbi:hypothetical protein Tco_0471111, partial [Tanacetum coccineum]
MIYRILFQDAHSLSTLHFLKFPENSLEVLKLLENSVEVLKILESKLESMKIRKNKWESLKLQENQPMSADVARGHGSDGGGDDRPPPHQIPTGCGGCLGNRGKGTRKPNLGGKRAGRQHTRQETQNLRPTTLGSSFGSCRCTTLRGAKCRRRRRRGRWQGLGPSLTYVPTWNPIAGHLSIRPSSNIYKRSTMARRLLLRKSIGFLTQTGLKTWSASNNHVPRILSRSIGMRRLCFGMTPRTMPGLPKINKTRQIARSYADRDPDLLPPFE